MKISKIIFAALAVTLGWATLSAESASAADAPANLTVSSGQTVQHSYGEFGSNTQITIERGGLLEICTGFENKATLNAAITFSGNGSGGDPEISISPCLGSPGSTNLDSRGATFNGAITLNTNAKISSHSSTLSMNGSLAANGHNLAITTAGVSRVRGGGTVGSVSLASGDFMAPGTSPGIINTGNLTFVSGSTYEFELAGTTVGTEYDQINVTGTVTLGDGTLSIILLNNFKPTDGQKFTIINNDGTDKVNGTFAGLAQGATITSGGYTYRISYIGGDGNDVVLSVGPGAPDTGFGLIMSNPLVTGGVMIVAAAGIMIVARKHGKTLARR